MSARIPIIYSNDLHALDQDLIERVYLNLPLDEQLVINELAIQIERGVKHLAQERKAHMFYVIGRRGAMELLLKLHLHMVKRMRVE